MIARLASLVESHGFQYGILGVIVLAAVLVGIETLPSVVAQYGALLHGLDELVLWIFAVEAALKILSGGGRWYRYFSDPWNVFDFLIVVICFMPIDSQYAAVLRLARVLRAMRLITAVPKLQLLVGSLLKSIPSLAYVGMLLGVLFYIYAVMGVFMFRGNDPVHFYDLSTSLLTLFLVLATVVPRFAAVDLSGQTVDEVLSRGKHLFIRVDSGALREIEPLSVLDFYVHESCQRRGLGKCLYERMLRDERTVPAALAYDRPSSKFIAFLAKHYGLRDYVPQANNFVVFRKYFVTFDRQTDPPRVGLARREAARA